MQNRIFCICNMKKNDVRFQCFDEKSLLIENQMELQNRQKEAIIVIPIEIQWIWQIWIFINVHQNSVRRLIFAC